MGLWEKPILCVAFLLALEGKLVAKPLLCEDLADVKTFGLGLYDT